MTVRHSSPQAEERVILVDRNGHQVGTAEKLHAHREGALHRAFSIFIFDPNGNLLLQRRARTKYHSGGLWSNTCCSHPRPNESLHEAVHRRLREEMGFDCVVKQLFRFTYQVQLADDLFEHEYDHVFVGYFDGDPTPNAEEIDDWIWIDLERLRKDIRAHPDRYTYWLRCCIDQVIAQLAVTESVESRELRAKRAISDFEIRISDLRAKSEGQGAKR